MKETKKIGKIVTLSVLTVVVLFYLLPNVALIEQTMEIKATPDRIFGLINSPENWAEWYTPIQDTSEVHVRLFGTPKGKGAGMQWVSHHPENATGIMNIRHSKNNRNVTAVVTVNDRHSAVMNFKIRPMGMDASMLTITSRLRFRQDSIWNYLRLMFDRSDELAVIDYMGKIDEAAMGKSGSIDVYLQQTEPFSYISITDSCVLEDMYQRMNDLYSEILVFGARLGINMTGRPHAIYHRLDEKQAVFELGVPVNEKIPVSGRIQYKIMHGGKHVVANYYGSYDTLEDGHNAIRRWMMRYRRKPSGNPWEMYVTDTATEPDPNKWLTSIYYPVE